MNAPQQQPNIPPLAALVYRSGKGCRQYAFASAEELEAWAARHPYRNETLRVMPVKDRKQLGDKWVPAAEAANYVRTAQGQNAELCGLRGFSRRSEPALCYADFERTGNGN